MTNHEKWYILKLQIVVKGVIILKRDKLINLRGSRTQDELANELGISQQHYSAIENGTRTPTPKLMFEFEKYFNVPVQELFPDIFLNNSTTNSGLTA